MPARFGEKARDDSMYLIAPPKTKPLSNKDYETKPIVTEPKKVKKVAKSLIPVDESEPVVEVGKGTDTIDATMALEKKAVEGDKSAVATKVSPIDTEAPALTGKPAAAMPKKEAIMDAVKKTTRNGTKLYHLKTSFHPHAMTPDAKMTAEHCYGIAVKRSKGESTVSTYRCPAVKGTCPSKLTSACTLTEITRIPSGVDVEAKVDEALLMRY